MTRQEILLRVRSITRDLSNSVFREIDIVNFINEGVERLQQIIPELMGMELLLSREDEPILLPKHYHHMLALYASSRCFGQDERHYQATNYMNEFETKIDELRNKIENGDIVIRDVNGDVVSQDNLTDHVIDVYYQKQYREDV